MAKETAKPSAKPSLAVRLVGYVGFLAFAASLVGFAGSVDWRIDLLSHFRFQYVLVLAVCVLAALMLRRWRMGAILGCGLAINAVVVFPLFDGSMPSKIPVGGCIRLAAVNVHTANRRFDSVVSYVNAEQPHIVFFQETDGAWIDALMQGLPDYKVIQREARSDNFGVLLMMRTPAGDDELKLVTSSIVRLAHDAADVPSVEVALTFRDQPLHLLCVHTTPPVNTPSVTGRDAMLVAAGEWANAKAATGAADNRFAIMGDLNATPWCSPFRQLLAATNLIDSSRGFGWQPTWPSGMMALGSIPIDHCLHSPGLLTVRREVSRDGNGSDHFPLLIELIPIPTSPTPITNTGE